MTEEIQKRIDGIIDKRKKFISDKLDCIYIHRKNTDWDILKKKEYNFDILIFKKEFIKYVKKEYRKLIKHIDNYYYKGWRFNKIEMHKLPSGEWDEIKQLLIFLKAIITEYKMHIKNKELHRLTNCLRTLEGNPCEITCEKCGYENQIGAKYCSKCGELI